MLPGLSDQSFIGNKLPKPWQSILPAALCDKATLCVAIMISVFLLPPGQALHSVRFLLPFSFQLCCVILCFTTVLVHAFCNMNCNFHIYFKICNNIININATKYCRMQVFVKHFNTTYQPFLVIALDSSENPVFLEKSVPRMNLTKHYTSYLSKHSLPGTVAVPVVHPHRSSPAKNHTFLI